MLAFLCLRALPAAGIEGLLSKPPAAGSDEAPWQITARKVSYLQEEELFVAQGDVVISKDDQFLYAQEAFYNVKTGMATVSGGVRLESGGDVFTGRRGVFDLKRKTGRIEEGVLFLRQNHYYLHGRSMEKVDEDTYLIEDCRLTTCDGENPDWSITGSRVRVTVEGYGTVRNAAFRVRGRPVLYVPYLWFPAKTKRQSGFLPPRLGSSSRNGLDLEWPFFWVISEQADATFYPRFLEKRGLMQGVELRYAAAEESRGIFQLDVLSDRKAEKDLHDPDSLQLSPYPRDNRTRYWLRAKADQNLPADATARLDVDLVSDQDYLREFETRLTGYQARPDLAREAGRPVEEKRSPTRRSALRIDRQGEDLSLQGLVQNHQRPEDPEENDTPQPRLGLHAGWSPWRIGTLPAYMDFTADYDRIERDSGTEGHRFSASPQLRLPLWLGAGIELEPYARYTYNVQRLERDPEARRSVSKSAYEAGVRTAAQLERIFPLGGDRGTRLRHRLWPELAYRYRDHRNLTEESGWFEPIDEEEDRNELTLSLENFLDARLVDANKRISYRQWVNFKLSQAFDIDEARRDTAPGEKRRPFEPLAASLLLTPHPYLSFLGDARWDYYAGRFTTATLSGQWFLPRTGSRLDSLSVDYHYRADQAESLNLRLYVNLIQGISVSASMQKDLESSEDISSGYWLHYDRQCWGVQVGAEVEDKDTKFTVSVRLLGLGEFRAD